MIAPNWRAPRALLKAIAALALAVSATTAFAQTNLLQNGSFESSSFTDSTAVSQGIGYASPQPNSAAANATIPSWTWTAGAYSPSTFALNQTGGALGVTAEDGTYSVSFGTGSAQSGGSISQSFAVTSGAQCTLSFWVRRIGAGQGIGANVQVTDNANGGAQVTLTDAGNVSYAGGYTVPIPGMANQWSQVVLKFTAPSTSLKFTFTDTTGVSAADSTDLGLDNVSLTAKTLQTLTIEGTDVAGGTIDPNTDCSRDGDVTWLPAYAANRSHPWGNIFGTTAWISRVADMASASTTTNSNPETLDFRIRFYAPSDISNAQLKYQINPDNYGDIFLNGTKLNATTITGGGGVDATATITNANIVAGLNTIIVRLTDTGGLLGINYRVDLQGYASTSFQRLVAPPAVTNITSSLANGSYTAGTVVPIRLTFTNAVTVTGTPTLTLSDGGTASYASGSGTTTVTFNYTVQAGQNSAHLDYASTSALALNGGTIISSAADAQAANLILPSPGASGSLSANTALVIDTTAPVVTAPANITTTATSSAGATATFTASATDNFSSPTISYSQASGSTFPVGTTTVTVTATDAAGNASTGSFTVTVNPVVPVNTISAPVLSVPANISVTATSAAGAVATFNTSATSTISSELFRRSTTTGEHWNAYSVTFAPTISSNYNLAFNLIAGGPSGDNSILVDAVKITTGATTVFSDGFESPALGTNTGSASSPGNTLTIGNWKFTNYSGILNGSPANWGLDPASTNPSWSLGYADGTHQYAYLQAAANTLGKMKSVQTVALVAGQVYTISFYQGSRYDFGGTTTYTVTLETTETDAVTASPLTSGSTFPVGTTPVTLTATNSVGGTTTGSFNVTVKQDSAAITFATPTYTYDGTGKPATATTSPAGLPVTFTYDGSSTAPTAAGTYAVVATVNQPWIAGTANGTLTISPAPLSVTAAPQTKVYGSADPALAFAITGGSLFGADSFSGSLARNAGENVGNYAIGQGSLTAGANYALTYVGAALTITPKPASVAPNAATKVYGAADPALTGTLSGFLPSDNVTAVYARTAGENVVGGPYTISATLSPAGVLSNYAITASTAAFTITPATLTVTANAPTKVYGSADPALTYGATGFQFAESATSVLSGGLKRAPGETVAGGPYAITQGTLASNANYTVAFTGNVLTITPATLVVTANAQTKVYGSADPALTYAANGLQFSDTAASVLTGALTRVSGETVKGSPYAIQQGTLAANTNYTVAYTGANLIITAATPTISVKGYTGIYDGQPHGATGTAAGVSSADLSSLLALGATYTNVPGGTANWTFHDPAGNYVDQSGNVAITLTQAAATIVVTPYSVTYDGKSHTATGTATGVNNEPLAGLVLTGTTHTNAGFYSTDAWTFSDAAGNYANAGATITDTIAKAPVTISLAPIAQMYDGTPKPVTATTVETPATSSLTVVITYNGSSTVPTLPGSYTVVATVVDPNYTGTVSATETVGITALVRHGISLDGEIDGSIQVLLPENDTLNGEAMISGDLLVPGTPTVRTNGHPTYGSTVDYAGNSAPSNYTVTLNGKAILRHVDRRVDALTLPIVAAPPIPTGKRNVRVDEHNPNPGDFSTINNLAVHLDDRATLTIPAGTYGKLTIDGGGTVVLGVAGATTPTVYNLQGFAANGDSRIQIAGPVIITVATGVQLNSGLGNSAHPEWLTLQIASGGVTLNGETSFYGYIVAPAASTPTVRNNDGDDSSRDGKGAGTSGTVIINGNASVTGGVVADRLVINGHGLLNQRGVVPPKSGGDRD